MRVLSCTATAPIGTPQHLTVTVVAPTYLLLDWQPPPGEPHRNGVSRLTFYELAYFSESDSRPRPQIYIAETNMLIRGLKPAVRYTFIVRAYHELGQPGPWSTPLTVATSQH